MRGVEKSAEDLVLPKEFYERPTIEVAQDCLGKIGQMVTLTTVIITYTMNYFVYIQGEAKKTATQQKLNIFTIE